jgi:hypothetical protein
MAEKKSKLAQIKTKPTAVNVDDFINAVADEQKRADSLNLMKIMKEESGEDPVLWGSSIIGFGNKRYKSPATGREVDWFLVGFAPRKANLTVYLVSGLKQHEEALGKLGKHKIGGGCLYLNKLDNIDLKVLRGIIKAALKQK